MPTKQQLAQERLATVLARQAAIRAADLAAQLGVSVPTLHRLLHASPASILVAGKARGTRYALRRPVRGDLSEYPLYAVDENGRATSIAGLVPVSPQGCWMRLAETDWPLVDNAREGWWEGLPYPLYDMRPQGYMGRQLARAVHHTLAVPEDPNAWNDDEILCVLSRAGADLPGNLILGDSACERWQQGCLTPIEPLPEQRTVAAYAELAEQALAAGVAGPIAAGEFPKFTALRALTGSATPHVLVKFSGADQSPAVTRWSDLLVSEHLALDCARTHASRQSQLSASAGPPSPRAYLRHAADALRTTGGRRTAGRPLRPAAAAAPATDRLAHRLPGGHRLLAAHGRRPTHQ